MIGVRELYNKLNKEISPALSCEWDNDGLMCSGDPDKEVKRALLALDVTKDTVKRAKEINADLIVSHHPLIFRPVKALNNESASAAKAIELIKSGVSVFSFHTRLDAHERGVNDILAKTLGIKDTEPFGTEGEMIGRIGYAEKRPLEGFALFVKEALGADRVSLIDGGRPVCRVALCGGDGKDFLEAAIESGADTYVTGSMSYNSMLDAYDTGINIIEAGHYFTEAPVLKVLETMIKEADRGIETVYFDSNAVKTL